MTDRRAGRVPHVPSLAAVSSLVPVIRTAAGGLSVATPVSPRAFGHGASSVDCGLAAVGRAGNRDGRQPCLERRHCRSRYDQPDHRRLAALALLIAVKLLTSMLNRPATSPCQAPPAQRGHDELHRNGHRLTRDALAARLRETGHAVRNSRLTPLLQVLRSEATTPAQPIQPTKPPKQNRDDTRVGFAVMPPHNAPRQTAQHRASGNDRCRAAE